MWCFFGYILAVLVVIYICYHKYKNYKNPKGTIKIITTSNKATMTIKEESTEQNMDSDQIFCVVNLPTISQ